MKEASRHVMVEALFIQFVAGQLHGEELVIGHIGVEGVDHPVSIAPGSRLEAIPFITVGLGPANQVEPVTTPVNSELGIGEQLIDTSLPAIWSGIGEITLHLLGSGRESRDDVVQSSQQRLRIGLGRRFQSHLFEAAEPEVIDAGESTILQARQFGSLTRGEGEITPAETIGIFVSTRGTGRGSRDEQQ